MSQESRQARSVWVAHPGAAPSVYEMVRVLAQEGFAARLQTGFAYPADGVLARAVAQLPIEFGAKLERELKRRQPQTIGRSVIDALPLPELAYVAAARGFPRRPEIGARLLAWRNRRFDAWVARRILAAPPAALIGHDTSTLRAIRAARRAGTCTIVNQLIGHIAIGRSILAEEAARFPDWADSLHADAPDDLVRQCVDEVIEADAVLSPSGYVRDTLVQVGVDPARIVDLPFGVRIDRFTPHLVARRPGPLRLVYVGQISQRKGLEYLLRAMPDLAGRAELTLVGGVVGSGRALARHEGRFRHIRNVPHAEVPALYRDADVLVYPSLHEGSALAIFEAMATGLPVITTHNSGSMVRHGVEGLIVPMRDSGAIAAAVTRMIEDPERRIAMGRAARLRAEAFTWERYGASLARAIEGLLAGRG